MKIKNSKYVFSRNIYLYYLNNTSVLSGVILVNIYREFHLILYELDYMNLGLCYVGMKPSKHPKPKKTVTISFTPNFNSFFFFLVTVLLSPKCILSVVPGVVSTVR